MNELKLDIFKKVLHLHSQIRHAQMAESVDALVSNTSGAIHPGSIPGLGTKKIPDDEKLLGIFVSFTAYTATNVQQHLFATDNIKRKKVTLCLND